MKIRAFQLTAMEAKETHEPLNDLEWLKIRLVP